ncbi:Hsp70 family protein [Rubripirellula amarantea]|uniref:Chaperone protein HscC n=1 Tax=Rubripirellula amarantea TaxID=2527999 RepID=A0A5C5WI67_9BACT|nr:Hsp70 family protein [Rubripirellula amarantea]MDA8745989.1 Hsp70 family protein [Rubripirellula amarantea]TWT50496.1 Chaperone protein HscC [Rubripirellula amarantea]
MAITPPIIGIDLGTTNSLCALFRDGKPTLIPNSLGSLMTPSVVGLLDDGQIVLGQAAAELRVTRPERTVSCFKRWIGTNRQVELGGQTFNANELSSLVLRSLREDAERFLEHEVTDAVITVPAYFNDNQRKATKLAGRLAGLNVRRILNEPTAAALTYGFHDRDVQKNMIVIDLGGGTFDVTVMEIDEGALEIVSTAGETQLGGEDFTTRLVGSILQAHGRQLELDEMNHPLFVSRLREQCEAAKRSLAGADAAIVRIPANDGIIADDCQSVTLTKSQAREIFDPLIKRLVRPISRAIRDARLSTRDIEDVILVGGATRDLAVQSFVAEMFDTKPHATIDPDQVVALGAAVQAALINDDLAVDDMVMTDVCPFTLGVEVAKEFGRKQVSGFYLPIIHRNTTIPVSKEEIVSTIEPNQRQVDLRVYQGESRKVSENLLLGNLLIKGIPPGPTGQAIHIRFTYDLNGILEVEAYIPETGAKYNTVFTNHVQGMNEREIEAAVKRMADVKFYPREEMANQRLLLYAEKAIGEVSPFQRGDLEHAVDHFEHAMESGDREAFGFAKNGLLLLLSGLGFDLEGIDDVSE